MAKFEWSKLYGRIATWCVVVVYISAYKSEHFILWQQMRIHTRNHSHPQTFFQNTLVFSEILNNLLHKSQRLPNQTDFKQGNVATEFCVCKTQTQKKNFWKVTGPHISQQFCTVWASFVFISDISNGNLEQHHRRIQEYFFLHSLALEALPQPNPRVPFSIKKSSKLSKKCVHESLLNFSSWKTCLQKCTAILLFAGTGCWPGSTDETRSDDGVLQQEKNFFCHKEQSEKFFFHRVSNYNFRIFIPVSQCWLLCIAG